MIQLNSEIYTLPIATPFVVGSCGLTNTADKIASLERNGAGAVVVKSIFEEEIEAQYLYNVQKQGKFNENEEFLDYFDYKLKKDALDAYCTLIKDTKKEVQIPVIASINCFSHGRWIDYALPLEEAGADAIEINAFFLPELGQKESVEEMYFKIAVELKQKLTIPVGFKIAPYISNLPDFVNKLSGIVDGITLFNRFYTSEVDIYNERAASGSIFSSPQGYFETLRWVSLLDPYSKQKLSASGGVHSTESAIKMLLAGATSVQIVSAIYLGGPVVLKKMNEGLTQWMENKNYSSLSDFTGNVSKSNEQKKHFERFQFMKYFGGHADQIQL